jgi:hypothetical protein
VGEECEVGCKKDPTINNFDAIYAAQFFRHNFLDTAISGE